MPKYPYFSRRPASPFRNRSIFFLIALLACLFTAVPAAFSAKARLAVLPLDTSDAGKFSYLGNALQQMLISRLASENLDVIPANTAPTSYKGSDAADFFVTGSVKEESDNRVSIDLELFTPDSDEPAGEWNIKPRSLDAIITETGRYSIIIGQKISDIENQRAIYASFTDTTKGLENSDKPLIEDETLRIARIHPDLLYREAPEDLKGTASPIDKVPVAEQEGDGENSNSEVTPEKESTASASALDTEEEEEDDWQPDYPPSYEAEPDKEGKALKHTDAPDNDDESWAEDYPPEYESSMVNVSGKAGAKAEEKESGWFSWLWPSSSDDKSRLDNEEKAMPKPVPESRLPYPVPKEIEKLETADENWPENTEALKDFEEELQDEAEATDQEAEEQAENARQTASDVISGFISSTAGETEEGSAEEENQAAEAESDNATLSEEVEGAQNESEAPSFETGNNTASQAPSYEAEGESAPEIAETIVENAVKEPAIAEDAAANEQTAEVTSPHSAPAQKSSRPGWFSWLWPSSWKGEEGSSSAYTAPATPAVEKKSGKQEYEASSQPRPKKGNGPVWVWQ